MSSVPHVVVSLTSFPAAITYAIGAIKSILSGSVLPDKIVLYLTRSQFENGVLPEELTDLVEKNPLVEIRYFDIDIRSYRKLIPALRDFPDSVIVTIDDDVDYDRDMLKKLLKLHKRFPQSILSHRPKKIKPDKPYKKWSKYHWNDFLLHRYHHGFDILPTGVGGVLYPPGALKREMLDPDLFTSIAPTMDDLWFWAAAVANGTEVVPVPFGYHNPRGLGKPRELSLKTVNFKSGDDRNIVAFRAILEKYPLIRERLYAGKK